jgi:hypothetical protein
VPNYLLVSEKISLPIKFIIIGLIMLISNFLLAQKYEDRKFFTDRAAIRKMASKKTEELNNDIKLSEWQQKKIKSLYYEEILEIDSLKYQPKSFFQDANRGRNIILGIKHETLEQINALLNDQQRRKLSQIKERRRLDAFKKINSFKQ